MSPAVTPEQLPFGTGDPDFRVDIMQRTMGDGDRRFNASFRSRHRTNRIE